jgi:glycosyltransferase involved in cell wall biosynthesis
MDNVPRPRVHFINRFFYPDLSATSQVLQGIAFDLGARGYDVHITTSRQLYEDASANLPTFERVRGVTIHRIATSRYGRGGIIGRAIDYGTFYASAAWHLRRTLRRNDILVAKTDPPLISVVAAIFARSRGATLVNWLQDVFPEVATASELGGRWGHLPLALLRRLRNWSLFSARCNVVIGERMAEYLVSLGVPPHKTALISNWADPEIIHPVTANPLLDEWELGEKIVVGYSGNLGRVHELRTLIDAIEDVQNRAHDPVAASIVFVFIGGGAMRRELELQVSARALVNVRLFPYQPTERLAETLAVVDLHLVSLRPEQEGFVVPSKIYGVMAAGRPTVFIGAADGEVARLLRHHDIGEVVAVGDAQALADAIFNLAQDREKRQRMGAAARAAFEADYTKLESVQRWDTLLTELAGEASAPESSPASSVGGYRRPQ